MDEHIDIKARNAHLNKVRRELLETERQSVIDRKEMDKRQSIGEMRRLMKHNVCIDTSKAGADLAVVRMCVREFHWIELPWNGKAERRCDIVWANNNKCVEWREMRNSHNCVHNKFPGMSTILGKANLSWCLGLLQKLYPEEYNFYPRTWILPQQYNEFLNNVTAMSRKSLKLRPTYIVKPDDGSQGDGIFLLKDPADCTSLGNRLHVVQEYIQRPLLIDGYKFDLRIYVTIRSIDPLEVYISREGMVRFCTVPYKTPTNKNLSNTYMHLTNYSLNKKSTTYVASENDDEGSKQTLTSVFRLLKKRGYEVASLWQSIKNLVCKTVFAVEPQMHIGLREITPHGKVPARCFQEDCCDGANTTITSNILRVVKIHPSPALRSSPREFYRVGVESEDPLFSGGNGKHSNNLKVLGFDILVCSDMQPVLLEVNSNPSLRIDHEQEMLGGGLEYVPSRTDRVIKAPMLRDALLLVAPKDKMAAYLKRKHKKRNNEKSIETQLTDLNISSDTEKPDNHLPKIDCNENGHLPKIDSNENNHLPKIDCNESNNNNNYSSLDSVSEEITCMESDMVTNCPDESQTQGDLDYEFPSTSPHILRNSTLQKIYPCDSSLHTESLRIFKRICDIFVGCLGVRENARLGPTAFRAFTRRCALTHRGLSNADVDILYIDTQRRWEYLTMDRSTGLCYQAFVDAFFEIARRKFYSIEPRIMIERLVDFCEINMNFQPKPVPKFRVLKRRNTILSPSVSKSDSRANLETQRVRPKTRNLSSFSFSLEYNDALSNLNSSG